MELHPENTTNKQFGRRLKEFRDAANMTEAQLAALIGQDEETIVKIERGSRMASAVELWDISAALDVKPHMFFEDGA